MGISNDPSVGPRLDHKRQTKFFLRCLKTFLPEGYTSNDSTRIGLAFFIVAALDLLDQLTPNTTSEERRAYIDWVYSNQHPDGGFRASPSSDLSKRRTEENKDWDPAHVPATYFALCLLLILDDDFARVKRRECLRWLRKLQRADGSFGETLVHGTIQGGSDSRFGYCATGIRYMLAGDKPQLGEEDIDVDGLVRCIRSAETYDGGISDAPFHESHAGLTFCGLAALSLMGRLSDLDEKPAQEARGPSDPNATIRWLVSRQTATIVEHEAGSAPPEEQSFQVCRRKPTVLDAKDSVDKEDLTSDCFVPEWTGLNGRCNKVADTCYAFWVGGSLIILGQDSMLHEASLRRWLLERTAHSILGGFGKFAGEKPDVYHSYLALAVLSMTKVADDNLQSLDPPMCISTRAKARLPALWERWGIS